jgi:transposase-like protein
MGMLERGGKVKVQLVRNPKRSTLIPIVKSSVETGSQVHTDALRSYARLDEGYVHQVIDHAESYVRGNVHTNGLENFWSVLAPTKRTRVKRNVILVSGGWTRS